MKLSVSQNFAAPQEVVFDRIADFGRLEERARARGAEILPLTEPDRLGWRILFEWRGMRHEVDMVVEEIARPESYTLWLGTRGVEGRGRIDIAALEAGSRLDARFDFTGTGMAGRFLMPTLAFARPALEGRLKTRLGELARELGGS